MSVDHGWNRGVPEQSVSESGPMPPAAPRQQAREVADALPAIEQQHMSAAHALAAKLGPEVAGTVQAIASNLHAGATMSGKAAAELERLSKDDLSNPDGIRRRILELRAKTPSELKRHYDAAADGIDVLAAQLEVGALPQLAAGAEHAAAIDEVRMLLDGKTGPEAIGIMQELAAGADRRLAAVVAGSWGRARLGRDETAHRSIRLLAVQASKKFGTPSERAHADAWEALPTALKKAVGTARFRATQRVAGGR